MNRKIEDREIASRSGKVRQLLETEPPYFIRYGTVVILFLLLLGAGLFFLIMNAD